jgi:predicted flap endonuclease-1-like 5' DNA nuclease
MDGYFSEIGIYLLAALLAGAAVGWLIKSILGNRQINTLNDNWQAQLDDVVRQRDRRTAETGTLRTSIEAQEAVIHQRELAASRARTELNSALEKEKLMQKNIFTLRAEREDFKTKMSTFQNRMASLQQQSAELQSEFIKSRDFYVGELTKSFEKRKALEDKVGNSDKEHESFRNLLHSSRSEQESVNKMLAAAKTRLDDLDALESSVIKLEAENAELKHDSARTRQENDALKRDIAEQEELKIQNKELAQVLKSMENSRKQYEDDANRYREHAGKHEKQSETLRVRLDEVEQNFLAIEKQQRTALKDARKSTAAQATNGKKPAKQEKDDLQEIIGIGKVFEHTLHELGIISFRQIAAFGVADIARVNAELKEFKGRMEQDDWIGQAKDLLFKKYGNA